MKTPGYRGYIFSRAIRGQIIPQRVQNLVVKSYAEAKGLPYLLSATEYYMPDSFMILDAVVAEEQPEGIVFYSLHMLPDSPVKRKLLYQKIEKLGIKLHFALENMTLDFSKNFGLVEDIKLVALACPLQLDF
jgi:sporadic carbohydrate cluster protein (TIGR04323 family)